MMHDYNKKYLKNLHFDEARAIFMMLTRMIDIKSNYKNKYKNIECETCKIEENTLHLFKCKKYLDMNKEFKGETLQEIITKNKEGDTAKFLKEIIRRHEKEKEEKINKEINKHRSPTHRVEPPG